MDEKNREESFASLLAEHEDRASGVEQGEKVKGKIIAISGDDVFVDIGLKQDGILDRKDIVDADGNEAAVGDEVEAFVIGQSSQGARLSRSMSGAGVAALEDAMNAGIPVEGRVTGSCKGGYHVEVLGKTAFCPGSQMEMDDRELAGKQLQFLITKVENHGRNIVVSRRALLDRERRESWEKLKNELKPGDVVEGQITRIAPFGAFMELVPGIEGMIHISELSWSRVDAPDEAVIPGDRTQAKILSLDEDDKGRPRISLSRKQVENDPWEDVDKKFTPGQIVKGKTRRLTPFGAFIEIAPGIEGLAHVSEMSWEKRISKPEDVLEPGQEVDVKIKEITPEKRRISLSLRDAQGDPWNEAEKKFQVGSTVSGVVENRGPHGLFITLIPGVTGLLPASALKNAPEAYSKLNPGDKVEAKVQKLDSAARRISLMPTDSKEEVKETDTSWRNHARDAQDAGGMGLMAQALENAMRKKNQSR